MTKQTERFITTVLAEDETIPKSIGIKVMQILGGKSDPGIANDTIKTRKEAAELLRVCPVTVTYWGKIGRIDAIRVKGRRKAVGYSLNSINRLMASRCMGE